jgi:hypothetical protein
MEIHGEFGICDKYYDSRGTAIDVRGNVRVRKCRYAATSQNFTFGSKGYNHSSKSANNYT